MGWRSYIEDMVARYEHSLHMAERSAEDPDISFEQRRMETANAFETARIIWKDILSHLEVATDPNLDLAQNLAELKSEVHRLRSSNGDLHHKLKALKIDLKDAVEKASELQSEKAKLIDMYLEEKECRESLQTKIEIFESLTPDMFAKYGNKSET